MHKSRSPKFLTPLMKNAPHFWEGFKLFFDFQKRGVVGLFCAQRQEEGPRFT
jgi:hypothetical protein